METLDLDRLLSPISSGLPCGENLRWDPAWDELSQLRRTRKDPLDSSADTEADWPKVVSLSTELLLTRTKDLLIAGWLTEALVRQHGFAGLRDGLRLIRRLSEDYWDGLYPLIEDGDLSLRAAPFSWLASSNSGARLPAVFREINLAKSKTKSVFNWNFWSARNAPAKGESEELGDFERRMSDADSLKKEFDEAVEATSVEYYRTLNAVQDECLQEIAALSTVVDDRLKDEAPSWSDLRKAVQDIQVFVRDVLKKRGAFATPEVGGGGESQGDGGEDGEGRTAGGGLRTRADAVARLEEVARFFASRDPQSPVIYLIRRAIRWTSFSFEELMLELVKDEGSLKNISETLGIAQKFGTSSESSE